MTPEALKRAAALAALDYVEPGMRLGLGTGSTATLFIEALGERVAEGLDVVCVPTSKASDEQARALGIALTTLDEMPELDLPVDGADEIDGSLQLIKGGGGALLREKIVAAASREMIVVADDTKRVETLGAFPLPVEIVPFGARATMRHIAKATGAGEPALRMAGSEPFLTDNGNWICDCSLDSIADPERLAAALAAIPGVVEHGLFIGIARRALIGTPSGVDTLPA